MLEAGEVEPEDGAPTAAPLWRALAAPIYRQVTAPDGSRRLLRSGIVYGSGPGGTSAFYESALGRLRRSDLEVSATGSLDGEACLPNAWPVDYASFAAAYRRAEALMRVRGETDPIDPDDDGVPLAPPTLTGVDAALMRQLRRNGLHPYRLRVGFDYQAGCNECHGRRCVRRCKADGFSRALGPALATGRVTLEAGVRVERLRPDHGDVAIDAIGREGSAQRFVARHVVLAAGALATPLILGRSTDLWGGAAPPALLGRGLMFHFSDRFAVRTAETSRRHPRKALAIRDFYGSDDLGEIQSSGSRLSAGVLMSALKDRLRPDDRGWRRRLLSLARPAVWLVARLLGPLPLLSTISEDLPYAANRVWEAADPAARSGRRTVVAYAIDPARTARLAALRARIRRAFAPLPVYFLSPPGTPNWGHPMGTCRMGNDPATSVVGPVGEVWGADRVSVADASVMPSSGGVGPSLTIVAHALRVADAVVAKLARETAAPAQAAE